MANPLSRAAKRVRHIDPKIEKVMHEFKAGTLRSSSGQKVTERAQALAIAMSEARRRRRKS